MTGKPKDKAAPGYEPDRLYRVTLRRPVKLAGHMVRPGDAEIVWKGKLCAAHAGAIASAEPVAG